MFATDGDQTIGAPDTATRFRWVFPGDGEPVPFATVEVGDDGRIVAVRTVRDCNIPLIVNVAVIPGLVNCHTHLEFSDLSAPLQPARPFTAWIDSLVGHRRSRRAEIGSILRAGLAESRASGTKLVGEIATHDVNAESAYPASPYPERLVVFREILGLLPEQIEPLFAIAERHLAGSADDRPEVIRGLSPHAPWSVHPDLYRRLVDLAASRGAPFAVHVAETRAELELLSRGTGELVEMLERFGVWRDGAIPRGSRPLDFLKPLAKVERALAIHGNYLDREEREFLAQHPNVAVVYCPRTHAFFGHDSHPWRELLDSGASVALGTDSRASNPDLSLWGELRFLRERFPDVPPQTLLELGTIRGARALGLDRELGTLTPGKSAAMTLVALPMSESSDPWSLLFSPQSRVVGASQERGARNEER